MGSLVIPPNGAKANFNSSFLISLASHKAGFGSRDAALNIKITVIYAVTNNFFFKIKKVM